MKSVAVTVRHRRRSGIWPLFFVAIVLAPACTYFVLVSAALLFGAVEPVEWVSSRVATSTWSSFVFVAALGGGPLVGIVACLIIRTLNGPKTLSGVLGLLALVLIICYPVSTLCLARFSPLFD